MAERCEALEDTVQSLPTSESTVKEEMEATTELLALESYDDTSVTVAVSMPPHYTQRSMAALILCCPLGLQALVTSLSVGVKVHQGDEEGARLASKKALKYSQRGIVAGIVMWFVLILVLLSVLLFGALYFVDYFHYYRPV